MAGRPETPLDPDEGPVARLAHELRELRAAAGGPTYRDMARTTGCGASTLSHAAAGRTLPTLAVVLAYATACGAEPGPWEERWHAAAEAAGAGPAEPGAEEAAPPYRGLRRYEPGDRALFFGRETVAAGLAARVAGHRLIALVGPSGSGKSSLLRAGLVPLLREERDPARRPAAVRILTPGPDPLPALSRAMTPAPGAGDTVVLVDQFEEVFTRCADPVARAAFLDLVQTATAPGSRLRLVLAVRADYFGRCAEHRGLSESLRETTLLLGPMSPDELREAIVRPAASAGLIVERALTARIIREVGEERGALPLMSHALLETWRRRRGRALTEEMYEAAGGIHGAIAHTAEEVYGALSAPEALAARRALLRLVTPGEGAEDVRRSAGRAELDTGHREAGRALDRLVDARLLTLDDDTVDLAHEALITAWPRFRGWIEEDRETLRMHRRLTEAARAWDDLDRDPGALYRGVRLATACDAFGPGDEALTPVEAAFLDAGRAARDADAAAAARTANRLRTLTLTLSVLLVLALTAGFLTWHQSVVSDRARHEAQAAEQAARADELSQQSTGLIASNPDLAALLAVEAYRTSPTPQARDSLLAAAALPQRSRFTGMGEAESVVFTSDGEHVVAAGPADALVTQDVGTARTRVLTPGRPAVEDGTAFTPDGRTLYIDNGAGRLRIVDPLSGRTLRTLRINTAKYSGADTDRDGGVVVIDGQQDIRVWSTRTGRLLRTIPVSEASAALSPDGRTVAVGQLHGQVSLWDVATGRSRRISGKLPDLGPQADAVTSLAFSPDGRTLATADWDGSVRLWDTATGRRRSVLAGTSRVTALAYSADGATLASGSDDGAIRLWNPANAAPITTLIGHSSEVSALAFSPDGRLLASGSLDRSTRVWNVPVRRHVPASGMLGDPSVLFTPDGSAVVATGNNGAVHVLSTTGLTDVTAARRPTGSALPLLPRKGATATTRLWTGAQPWQNLNGRAVTAFTPSGRPLVLTSDRRTTRLSDPETGRALTLPLPAGQLLLLFGPDGHTVVTVDNGSTVHTWDADTGRTRTYPQIEDFPNAVAMTPDGRTLLLAPEGVISEIRLRDGRTGGIETPAPPGWAAVQSILAVSPDGRTVASVQSGTVQLWDIRTGKLLAKLVNGTASATALAFSPDGRTLATGYGSGGVGLWDLATRRLLVTDSTDGSRIASLAFSPDGHQLTAGDQAGDVWLWNASLPAPAGAISAVCRAVARDLTAQERAQYAPQTPAGPVC